MARYKEVSLSVIRRLPRYYRFLGELLKRDVHRISSRELAERLSLTASQIRQDLNCFGGFGQQGYGYNVDMLHQEIGKILGLDAGMKTILIGAGNLGTAIANHMTFENKGFRLVGIFDANPQAAGRQIRGLTVRHTDELEVFCGREHPQVAILCVPSSAVLEVSKRLIDSGVRGFWNFSHMDLKIFFDNIVVENVHLSDSLMTLCYQMNEIL